MSDPKPTDLNAPPPPPAEGERFGSLGQSGAGPDLAPDTSLPLDQTLDSTLTSGSIPPVPTADDLTPHVDPSVAEYLGSLPPIPELGPDPLDGPVIPTHELSDLMPPEEFSDELSAFALIDWPDGPDLDQLLPPPPDPPPSPGQADPGVQHHSADTILDGLLGLSLISDPGDDDPDGGMFGA